MSEPMPSAGDRLIDTLRGSISRGGRPLGLRAGGGSLHLAVWRYPGREIEEIDVGEGPFERPSRSGYPEFWAAERRVDPSHWQSEPLHALASGAGLHDLPLGPVRADVAESLRYEMRVLGDQIFSVRLLDGFKSRGVQGLMQGRDVLTALDVAERVTGTSPVAHALAYSLAVEDALGMEASVETARQRTLLAECERLYSHLGDLAALVSSTGTPVPAAELYRLKDMVLRFNHALTGHRYLRGAVAPGGMRRSVVVPGDDLRRLVEHVEREFTAIRAMLDRMTSYLDRLHGAGRVPSEFTALVGFVGRAAGLSEDVRWDRPYAAYGELVGGRLPAIGLSRDAHARYLVRCAEIDFSLLVLRRLADAEGGALRDRGASAPQWETSGWGVVEAPRGRLAYRVSLQEGTVQEVSITTPSSVNWPAVPAAVSNRNILQDFPIIDASFNLCVAALDL